MTTLFHHPDRIKGGAGRSHVVTALSFVVAGATPSLADVTSFDLVDPTAPDLGLGQRCTNGSDYPSNGIEQAVRVVWAGGVTLENGDEPGDAERDLDRVTVRAADGIEREITPTALANLGDGDNNHLLCLDTSDIPVSVSFPAGILTNPNDDLNPATSVAVRPAR